MAIKKTFTDESLSALVSEIKSYTDNAISTKANSSHTHTISDVKNLQNALDGKADTSHGTHVTYSTTNPVMDGTASVGSASTVARSDHKHPTDTSRASKTEFDTHNSDTAKHITSTERTNWNAAKTHADSAHAPSNAEKNQNAFSNVKVGSTTISADSATDTLTLDGSNVTITPDATNDKVTIGITKSNVTTALGYTPPESNTWRGIQDNLTSISTTDSLSANQGKLLKDLVDTKASSSHKHNASDINDGTLSSDRLPIVPITNGGTGATTAADALTKLGAAKAAYKSYGSFETASTGSDGWYTIFTINDNTNGSAICTLKGYSHSSVVFTVTKGYSANATLNILDCNTSSNGSYAYIKALRILADGKVQAQINTGTVNISINIISANGNVVPVDSLVCDTSSPTVCVTRTLTQGKIVAGGFIGDLTGNAATATSATKATQDGNGKTISSTYETKTDASSKLNEAKTYADYAATTAANAVKNDLLNGAGTAYDTLKELGDLIDDNVDAIETLEAVAANKADKNHAHAGTGDYSTSIGANTTVSGNQSTAVGQGATITNVNVTTLGQGVTATSDNVTALGQATIASGSNAIAIGQSSKASGENSISIGQTSAASGAYSIAIGQATQATSDYSTIIGQYASGGISTTVVGQGANTEGDYAVIIGAGASATGDCATVIGQGASAAGAKAIAIGQGATATGNFAVVLGSEVTATGDYSFATGYENEASGNYSHVEGISCKATDYAAHAEGDRTEASSTGAHAEGQSTIASGLHSHAEGRASVASGSTAHAEGMGTTASATAAHSEGTGTTASGMNCHAEGANTVASGFNTHAEGTGTIASGSDQHVQGRYNIDGSYTYAHIVGNGSSEARSNMHTLDWSGNAWFQGDVYIGSTSGTNKDSGSKKLLTEDDLTALMTAFETRMSNLESRSISVYTTISLPASAWEGNIAPYYQVVSIPSATANTKVDLEPTVLQLVEMQENNLMFKAENDDGVITVYSINNKPETDYTIQASLREVTFV